MIEALWKDMTKHPFIYLGMLIGSLVTIYVILDAMYSLPVQP